MNMSFNTRITHLSLAVLAALTTVSAQAHDIVLEPQREGIAVRYGHAKDWQQVQDGKLVDLQVMRGTAAAQDMRCWPPATTTACGRACLPLPARAPSPATPPA